MDSIIRLSNNRALGSVPSAKGHPGNEDGLNGKLMISEILPIHLNFNFDQCQTVILNYYIEVKKRLYIPNETLITFNPGLVLTAFRY